MIKVHLTASNTLGGWLIRLLTFSRWNHASIEIDGIVYEALLATGVRTITATSYRDKWKRGKTVELEIPDKEAAKSFLRAQVGKPYDWTAIIALPFRQKWQKQNRWFCSELVASALVAGGMPGMRIEAHRITPRDLWVKL